MRHLSLIRSFHFADVLTLANGGCGVGAVMLALMHARDGMDHWLYLAATLIVAALAFDFLDGRVARWRQAHSAFGRELDSLADIVSFGVAPTSIAFAAGLDSALDALVLVFFTLCGLSRLARYNVSAEDLADDRGKVAYFEGTPIPTSIVPLLILIAGVAAGELGTAHLGSATFHLLVLPFALSGCLMVSKTLRIPKP